MSDIVSAYNVPKPKPSGVAVPKLYEYRERFKNHTLSARDVIAPKQPTPLVKVDNNLEQFGYKGEKLFFGDGLTEEF